jgi:hypothetical protein
MLCTSMGCEEIASIYVVSYYMVDFKIRPIKVHLWKALSVKPNCKMTSSTG